MTKTVSTPRAAVVKPAVDQTKLIGLKSKNQKAGTISNSRQKYNFELLPGIERSLRLPLGYLRKWMKRNDDDLSHCVAEVTQDWRRFSMPNWRFPCDCFSRAIQFLARFGGRNARKHNAVYVFGEAMCGGICQHGWVEIEDRVVFDGVQQQFYTKQGFYASQLARPWYRYTRAAVMALVRRKQFRDHFRWESALCLPWASDPTNPLTVTLDMVKEILAVKPEPTLSETAKIIDRLR